jgi:hypothetical protein
MRSSDVGTIGLTEGQTLALAKIQDWEGHVASVMMNKFFHYAVVAVDQRRLRALYGYHGREGNSSIVQWWRPAIIHVSDGGISLGVLGKADEAHHGCDRCRGPLVSSVCQARPPSVCHARPHRQPCEATVCHSQ